MDGGWISVSALALPPFKVGSGGGSMVCVKMSGRLILQPAETFREVNSQRYAGGVRGSHRVARQTWIEQPLSLGLAKGEKGEFRAGVRGRETRRFAGSVRMVPACALLKTLRHMLHQ